MSNKNLEEKIDLLMNLVISLKEDNRKLINKVDELEAKIDKKNIKKKNDIEKTEDNKRGAGRSKRFTNEEELDIKMFRLQGKTIQEIAKMYNCSTGLIHRIVNSRE